MTKVQIVQSRMRFESSSRKCGSCIHNSNIEGNADKLNWSSRISLERRREGYRHIQIVYDNIDDAEGLVKTLRQQTLFDKDIMD